MSLRPSIYAADITQFRLSLFEPANLAQFIKVAPEFCHEHGIKATAAEIDRDINLFLTGGWNGKPETDQQVYIIGALAHACGLDSDSSMIHWGDWKIGAYDEYFDMLRPILPSTAKLYCEFLRRGRAMFGTVIETEWSYYSYLTADEVRHLSAALASAHARLPELDSADCIHGFPTEFRGWLAQIEKRRADLWLFSE